MIPVPLAGGSGLGLSISKQIAEAHGGRLWLHSNKAGATEFRLLLPVTAPDRIGL